MRTRTQTTLSLIAWLAAAAFPAAQAGLPKSTQLNPGTIPVARNGNFVVIGCLARQGNGAQFTLTDGRATPPAMFRVEGDPDLLKIHAGHTLEIGGPMTAASGSAPPSIKVVSLTYISTKCEKQK